MVEDLRLIIHIRRANIDTFWVKEPWIVVATRSEGNKIEKLDNLL